MTTPLQWLAARPHYLAYYEIVPELRGDSVVLWADAGQYSDESELKFALECGVAIGFFALTPGQIEPTKELATRLRAWWKAEQDRGREPPSPPRGSGWITGR